MDYNYILQTLNNNKNIYIYIMNYKEKYLKYKLKYLNLKRKLHGGMAPSTPPMPTNNLVSR